jgi:hypothetical protein
MTANNLQKFRQALFSRVTVPLDPRVSRFARGPGHHGLFLPRSEAPSTDSQQISPWLLWVCGYKVQSKPHSLEPLGADLRLPIAPRETDRGGEIQREARRRCSKSHVHCRAEKMWPPWSTRAEHRQEPCRANCRGHAVDPPWSWRWAKLGDVAERGGASRWGERVRPRWSRFLP